MDCLNFFLCFAKRPIFCNLPNARQVSSRQFSNKFSKVGDLFFIISIVSLPFLFLFYVPITLSFCIGGLGKISCYFIYWFLNALDTVFKLDLSCLLYVALELFNHFVHLVCYLSFKRRFFARLKYQSISILECIYC